MRTYRLKKMVLLTVGLGLAGTSLCSPQAFASRLKPLSGTSVRVASLIMGGVLLAGGPDGLIRMNVFGQTRAAVFPGLLLLENAYQPGIKFALLSREEAEELRISTTELAAFNQSIVQLNSVAENISSDLARSSEPSVDFTKSRWEIYGQSLPSEALTAIKKISGGALKSLGARGL